MTEIPQNRTLVVEHDVSLPTAKVWTALTSAELIKRWLMDNDFEPTVGHSFNFRAEPMQGWNGVTDCEVLAITPEKHLSYSWNASGDQAEGGLKTTVTWTLQATDDGTYIKMQHAGFRPEDEAGLQAMGAGWPRIITSLEEVAAGIS